MTKGNIDMCLGGGCELKESCVRFDPNLNPKKVNHLSHPPFKIKNGITTCGWYVDNELMNEVKRLLS